MEAMFKYIALNYGNNDVTDGRVFRLFSSAMFNSASLDLRKELDYHLQRLEKGNEGGLAQRTALTPAKEVKVHYRIIHFTKFC